LTALLTFKYEDMVITYYKIGSGPDPMLAFHGFGQNASVFSIWEQELGNDFTIYSLNLFFHGSLWPYGDMPLECDQLEEIMLRFLADNRIDRFSISAYSIGAKFALIIAHRFFTKINRVLLLAPDGLKLNCWYRVATGTSFTRAVFRYFVDHGNTFMGITNLAGKLGIVNSSTIRFVNSQMANAEKRNRVFFTWIVFRKIYVNPGLVAAKLNEKKIQVFFFIGEKDRIITLNRVKATIKLFNNSELILLPVDHHHLISGFVEWFKDRPRK
jgi:pimeloyl-ACP methyl ester carboxylesterase